MDFSQFKDNLWSNLLFYLSVALLLVAVAAYGGFLINHYFLGQDINKIDLAIAASGTPEQKASEQKVLAYKKRIENFSRLINNHRISSTLFTLIEEKTLPDVWFSTMNVSEIKDEISLAGQAKTLDVLSQQVAVFEASKDFVKSINVLTSQASQQGGVGFVINLVLNPSVFAYRPQVPVDVSTATQ